MRERLMQGFSVNSVNDYCKISGKTLHQPNSPQKLTKSERLLLIPLEKHKSRNRNCLVLDQMIMLIWGNKISQSGFRMRDSFFKPRSGSHPFYLRSQSSGRKLYVDWCLGRRSTCHGKCFLTFYSKLSFLFSLFHTFLNVMSLRRDGHMNYHFLSFIQTKA